MAAYCIRYSKCMVKKKYPANTSKPNPAEYKKNQTP